MRTALTSAQRSVLIVRGASSPQLERELPDGDSALVVAAPAGPAQTIATIVRVLHLHRRREFDCVVTQSPPGAAHAPGRALRALGVPWIAHMEEPWGVPSGGRWWRTFDPRVRALKRASLVTTRVEPDAENLHGQTGASVTALDQSGAGRLANHIRSLTRRPETGSLRILMLGTLNTPHVEHLALAMRDRGHDVRVAGDVTPAYPPSVLPDAGIPASALALPAIPALRRLVRELRPDVVHAHWLYGFGFLAAIANAHPLVVMAWGSDVYLANARQRAYGRFALRRADLAMTDSAALRARLLEMGADESRTELVNWGVDLNCFRPSEDRTELRRRLGLDDRPVLLSPRGFGSVYNTKTILEAYERAKERVPDLQLVLKHLASEDPDLGRALPEDVRVVGHVPYEQMRDWFCAADICISIPNSDSSPRSVWEAMACGVPCVLSDLPWVHELIQPATHALVVPIDPQPVADAIAGLALDPRLRAQISSAGRSLVAEHKDAKAEMDRLSDVYVALARRER